MKPIALATRWRRVARSLFHADSTRIGASIRSQSGPGFLQLFASPPVGRDGAELFLLALLILIQWALILPFTFFPSIDGPAHLHLGFAYAQALLGDGFYQKYFYLDVVGKPNLLSDLSLVVLNLTLPPLVSEKVLLLSYFAGFTAAGYYCIKAVNARAIILLPLIAICSFSIPLTFGFYNFSFAAVIFMFWFGYWWKYRNQARVRVFWCHFGFAVLAYVTHLFALLVTLMAISISCMALAAVRLPELRRQFSWRAERRFLWTHLAIPILASTPALVGAGAFLLHRERLTLAGAADLAVSLDWARILLFFVGAAATSSTVYSPFFGLLFSVFLISILWFCLRLRGSTRLRDNAAILICAGFFAVIYLILPFQWLVRWMPLRFLVFLYIMIIIAIAAALPPHFSQKKCAAIFLGGMIILVGITVSRCEFIATWDAALREFVSVAPSIKRDSTLVALRLNRQDDVMIQAGSYLATLTHSVDLKNFQGQAAAHPIQFRPGKSAYQALGGDSRIVASPPNIDVLGYEKITHHPIDYILVWGDTALTKDKAGLNSLFDHLNKYYVLVAKSRPHGFQRLYRRRSK